MSHLTDGQIHAYLDGSVEALDGATLVEARSHIADCDDCNARLEAARLVRDEAVSLLGTAVPSSFSPPPFEELERRAAREDSDTASETRTGRSSVGGRNAASGRLFRRPGSLAWAASLTVALTAGWLARGTVGTGMVDRPAVVAPSESIALQDKQEVRLFSADSLSELKEGRNAQAAREPEFYAATEAELDEEGADRWRDYRAAMDEVAPETAGQETAPADDRPAPVAEEIDARRLEMRNRGQGAEHEPQREAAKMARRDLAGRPPADLGVIEGPADWQPVRREQAEALLGGALKTVEGLPVLSVYARAAGAPPEVWTAQQLASGHQLNLRQTPLGEDRFGDLEEGKNANERDESAADPISEMARPQRQQQAYYETLESLVLDGFLIEARAPLSPDSLRVLLSRLRD